MGLAVRPTTVVQQESPHRSFERAIEFLWRKQTDRISLDTPNTPKFCGPQA